MKTKQKQDYALQQFSGSMNCAQSVMLAFADELGIDKEVLVKTGAAFGGGMGEGEICGAVSGALMVIGNLYGDVDASPGARDRVSEMSGKFKSAFEKSMGSLHCKDLLGVNLKEEKGYDAAREKGLFQSHCPNFIREAIRIVDCEIIDEKK